MKIIDLHCDTLLKLSSGSYSINENKGHITDSALQKGGYMAQCFAIYTSPEIKGEDAFIYLKNQYKVYKNMLKNSNILSKAENINDVEINSRSRKVSAILTIENAELLNGKIERINIIKNIGARILGLIHNGENCLGYPHSIEKLPLKNFGKEVIEALNYTDIFADVSHLNFAGFCDVASISKKPIIATHSACRDVFNHTRNLYDNQIKEIANSGGIIGIPFYSFFLDGTNNTKIESILCHLEHLINTGGEDVAAIGSDFDGIDCDLFLKTCAEIQILVEAILLKFGERLTEKICYKNVLRVLG